MRVSRLYMASGRHGASPGRAQRLVGLGLRRIREEREKKKGRNGEKEKKRNGKKKMEEKKELSFVDF